MHDGMSTFFIVTTSDLIGLDSKTAKKVKVQGAFCLIFFKVSSNLRPNRTTCNFLKILYLGNFIKEAKLLAIVFCYSDWLSTNIS